MLYLCTIYEESRHVHFTSTCEGQFTCSTVQVSILPLAPIRRSHQLSYHITKQQKERKTHAHLFRFPDVVMFITHAANVSVRLWRTSWDSSPPPFYPLHLNPSSFNQHIFPQVQLVEQTISSNYYLECNLCVGAYRIFFYWQVACQRMVLFD